MNKYIKKISLGIAAMITLGALIISPNFAIAAPVDSACEGLTQIESSATCGDEDAARGSFTAVIKNVINILSIVVGAVSVIMIVIGGFRYVISGGDSNGIQGAKNTLIYALVGLVVAVFAQLIARFVLAQVK